MKKTFIAAALLAASTIIPAQAAPTVGQGLGLTLQAVLQRPVGTVTDIVRGYPGIINEVAPVGIDLFLVIPALLTKTPIAPNFRTVTVPLPGPAFLNMNLVNLPGALRVNVAASGPLVVTVATGGM